MVMSFVGTSEDRYYITDGFQSLKNSKAIGCKSHTGLSMNPEQFKITNYHKLHKRVKNFHPPRKQKDGQ